MLFTSLVKFIPKDFFLYGAVVNEIVFLISLFDSSFLVYRKLQQIDFCILNEYIW